MAFTTWVIFAVFSTVDGNLNSYKNYNIHNKCKPHLNGVFDCGRIMNGKYRLSGDNVTTLLMRRSASDVEILVDEKMAKSLNQIKIKIGICPDVTVIGVTRKIKIEVANTECHVNYIGEISTQQTNSHQIDSTSGKSTRYQSSTEEPTTRVTLHTTSLRSHQKTPTSQRKDNTLAKSTWHQSSTEGALHTPSVRSHQKTRVVIKRKMTPEHVKHKQEITTPYSTEQQEAATTMSDQEKTTSYGSSTTCTDNLDTINMESLKAYLLWIAVGIIWRAMNMMNQWLFNIIPLPPVNEERDRPQVPEPLAIPVIIPPPPAIFLPQVQLQPILPLQPPNALPVINLPQVQPPFFLPLPPPVAPVGVLRRSKRNHNPPKRYGFND